MTAYTSLCISIVTKLKYSAGNVTGVELDGNKALDNWFDEKIAKKLEEFGRKLLEWLATALSWIVDLVAIGIVILLYFHILKWMFYGDDKSVQRIAFGYLLIILLRIFSGILRLDITPIQ